MSINEWIRKDAFWALDFIRGSCCRKHYLDIKAMMERGSDAVIIKKHEDYLANILKYATSFVPFYKQFKGYLSLRSFPVINKNIIKENFQSFQSPEFIDGKVHNMLTSGSTGTPFLVRQDQNKRNRVYAEMIYFWEKAGYRIGMRYIFFRIWVPLTRKSRLTTWSRNLIMWDIQYLDSENLANIRKKLKSDSSIKAILGYANTLENIANYLQNCGDTPEMFHIETILAGSEMLSECTREKLKRVFGCNIVSYYSNQENGLMAMECVARQEFHANTASYHIELLKLNSDEPVKVGETGRIVVTDLFNHAMPLIRYDTGDIGIWKDKPECSWDSQVISSVEGRLADFVYTTNGRQISPFTIATCLCTFDKLLQFQFIQEGEKQYTLKLNGGKEHYQNERFVEIFKGVLGQDAEICIQHVSEIPILKSGKRKEVLCNYQR